MKKLLDKNDKIALQKLSAKYGFKNELQMPKISKVVINCGFNPARDNETILKEMKLNLAEITGQIPAIRKAKKAIAGFKIRKGDPVGYIVTLRGKRMHDFLEKLIRVALPRIRDFKGLDTKGFDGHGNYTLALREHITFPEIQAEEADKLFGMQISIVTTAGNNEVAKDLLQNLGFVYRG